MADKREETTQDGGAGTGVQQRAWEAGWLSSARAVPSPNFDERPPGALVEVVVVHAISLPPEAFGGPGIEQLFTNRLDPQAHPYYASLSGLRVSAHFLIRRDGQLLQFVSTHSRAWHAGVSSWCGRERCNDFSIGIELEGSDHQAFEPAQYDRLSELIGLLAACHPLRAVVGHADIAPGRKTDPGPFFDWAGLGLALARRRLAGLLSHDGFTKA